MKYLQTAAILFIGTLCFGQNVRKVIAKNEHITVFQQKAQIDASAQTNLSAGTTQIILEEIAGTADANSIKLGGKGEFTILGVTYQPNYLSKKTSAYQDSLQNVNTEIESIEMLLNVATYEEKMILENSSNMKSQQDGLVQDEFREMIDFVRTKFTEVGARKLQLKQQKKQLETTKNRIEQHLANNGSNQQTGSIIVTVSAQKSTTALLEFSYIAYGAGWNSMYDIRFKTITDPVKFGYKANVYQNTGIDWENVKLSLSTASPSAGNSKPDLQPQYLSFYQPHTMPMYKSARMAENTVTMAMNVADEAVQAAAPAPFVVEESLLSVNFNLSVPYTIRSNNQPEMVEVQNFQLPADFTFMAVPKLSSASYLVANLKDWEKYNLLPGKATVYFDGMLIGETYIKGNETKEELVVSLGEDKKIITKREEIIDFKNRKSIGGNIKESFGHKISLKNTKSEVVTLTLEDQLPVSQDSKIEVETEELSGGEVDPQTGKITWKITLQAQQNKEIILKYNVKYPKDKTISNL